VLFRSVGDADYVAQHPQIVELPAGGGRRGDADPVNLGPSGRGLDEAADLDDLIERAVERREANVRAGAHGAEIGRQVERREGGGGVGHVGDDWLVELPSGKQGSRKRKLGARQIRSRGVADPQRRGRGRKVVLNTLRGVYQGDIAALDYRRGDCDDLAAMLDTLAAQTYPLDRIHLVIVDNASTDGSPEMVVDRLKPDRIIDNATDRASQPAFVQRPDTSTDRARTAGGFRSITLIRNQTNFGGCGGYNTALAYAEHAMQSGLWIEPIAYAWLHDDDELLAPDALDQLVRTAQADPTIALVGSRMVDPADHERTVETTVFLSHRTGLFAPSPEADHPLAGAHQAWLGTVGDPTGRSDYRGTQDCDICSATSLLARWTAVEQVGFWDDRFFIAE